MLFERVAVIGVGLIGGSFALALKAAKACSHVVGAGRNRANLELARERGVIDSIAADAVAAAHGAELVLVAAPVAQFPRIFHDIGPVLGPKVSSAWSRSSLRVMSVCSVQSESSWTRPCCMRTPPERRSGRCVNRV